MQETGFFNRRLWQPLLAQLRQGTSPDKLATSVAVGATISVFPIFGATTPLCIAAGAVFKLNQVVLQIANYLATPVQLASIPLLIRIGETVFGLEHVTFNPIRLGNELRTAPKLFFQTYAASGLAGVAVWAVLAPISILVLRGAFLCLLKRRLEAPVILPTQVPDSSDAKSSDSVSVRFTHSNQVVPNVALE